MRGTQGRKLGLGGAFALLFVVLAVPLAGAAEVDRTEYRDMVEPICKQNVLANKQIFKGAKQEVKAGELKRASRHFFRAATAFAKTIRELAAVPRPTADEAKLEKWLDVLREQKDLIKKIGQALAAEQKHRAESYSVELNRNSNKANNAVLGFSFDYCRIESSRFG
jgi:hypothetical protein